MISGYFMMRSYYRKNVKTISIGLETINFISHKFKHILYFIIPSVFFGFIVHLFLIPKTSFSVLNSLLLTLYEIIPLQTVGFPVFCVTGTMWYVSALFISIFLLYPCILLFRDTFTILVCPLISLFLYGLISHSIHTLDAPDTWMFNVVSSGLLRGLAGVSAGCFLYELSERFRVCLSGLQQVIVKFIEIICYILFFCIMIKFSRSALDFVAIPILCFLIITGISGYSIFSIIKRFKYTKSLAEFCIALYLNHFYWRLLVEAKFDFLQRTEQVYVMVLLSLISSFLVYSISRNLSKNKIPF